MVLLVDDEMFALEMMCRKLENSDIRTFSATNIKDAIEIMNSNPKIKVVVTDIFMPEHNGFELIEWISKNRPEIKKIVVSAHSYSNEFKNKESSSHIDYILSKPIDVESELMPIINNILNLCDDSA